MMCYYLLYSFASAVVILLHRNDANKKIIAQLRIRGTRVCIHHTCAMYVNDVYCINITLAYEYNQNVHLCKYKLQFPWIFTILLH